MGPEKEKRRTIDAESEALVRARLSRRPGTTQRELRELLASEQGVYVDENAFGAWARRKGLSAGDYKGLGAFTPTQVERAILDAASPLDETQRAYLAARKGIGAEPAGQKEAARRAGLATSRGVRLFERVALERLRGYFAEAARPSGGRDADERRPSARKAGPPLGVSSTEVARSLVRARRAGTRIPERQERVLRGLWGVEGEAQLRPVELAREIGVHPRTVRDAGLRALAALRRAGHLSDPAAPEKERRAHALPHVLVGLSEEDLAALAEAFLPREDAPSEGEGLSLPNAEILRLAYGLTRPAHRPRPLVREVAAELGFVSEVGFKRARAGAIEHLLGAAGLEDSGPEDALSTLEEKAAERLRRTWRDEGGLALTDDTLPAGPKHRPNSLGGLNRSAVDSALRRPYGLLSRRERYVLGLRGGLCPNSGAGPGAAPTQGELAESMGLHRDFLRRLEQRAAEKLRRLLQAAPKGSCGPST